MWRIDRLPPAEEYLALMLERTDMWERAHLGIATGQRVRVPAGIHIQRPGQPETPQRKVERDPRKIARFFEGG